MARIAWLTAFFASLAAPAGAQSPTVVAMPAGAPAVAVNETGDAVLAGVATARSGAERLTIALRGDGAGGWSATAMGRPAAELRDPQAAMTLGGRAFVVWAQATRGRHDLRVATAVRHARARTVQTLTVSSAYSASPRLAVLGTGAVLLAYRHHGRLVVRVAGPGEARFGRARAVGGPASGVAATAAGGGAVVAWTTPSQRGRPRTAYSRRLYVTGEPRERAVVVSRDTGGIVRLGGSDRRALVSWVRPRRGARPAAAYTRSLAPALRPARPLGLPGTRPRSPATLALHHDRALAVLGASGESPSGFRVLAARSIAGGVWTGARELGAPSPMGGTPRPILLPDGTELVVWTTARNQVGRAVYDVLATSPAGTASLGTTRANDGRGLVVAQAGSRALAAWPADSGIGIAELG